MHTSTQYLKAGELVCGFRALILEGLRKLRPRVELQRLQRRKVRTLATEQKRNVHPASDDDTHQIVEDAGRETVKRPSCKWKGQTDADEDSARSAGSPISRMPQSTKGGLRPTRQPTAKPTIYLGFLNSMTFSGVVQTKLKPSSISL